MEEKEVKQECLKLMETAEGAYLSTIDGDGFPQTRMMGNLRNKEQCRISEELFAGHNEDFLIYMLTGHSSDKMPAQFHTLLLVGNVEEIDDVDLKKRIWQDEWKIHWPGGAEDPEFIMLKLLPEWAKGWHKERAFEFRLK
jgi:general stress protein 26